MRIFQEYPWEEQASLLESLPTEAVHFSPSIRFTNQTDEHSLELSLYDSRSGLEFYLWYARPVTRKNFFGLLGQRTEVEVVDKRPLSKEQSAQILSLLIKKSYDEIETRMA